MSYKSIVSAADGWFFVQKVAEPDVSLSRSPKKRPRIIQRVAAWAIAEDGRVVGLVGNFEDLSEPQARLIERSNDSGYFINKEDLFFTDKSDSAPDEMDENQKKKFAELQQIRQDFSFRSMLC